jgi:hypothetical protein
MSLLLSVTCCCPDGISDASLKFFRWSLTSIHMQDKGGEAISIHFNIKLLLAAHVTFDLSNARGFSR